MSAVSVEQLVEAGRAASMTAAVINDWAARGTPKKREYLYEVFKAEQASRRDSRCQRLLRTARLPSLKTLEGYDWTAVSFPADYGREQLAGLQFLEQAQDLVLFGDVGTGKTHLATALSAAVCLRGIPARFSPPPHW